MNTGTPHLYSPLIPALRSALAGLLAGAVCATLSALCMLAALWCMVRLVGEVSLDWALAAVALWLSGALLAACASWLAHAAEGQFSARLRRQVAGHLLRLPVSTLARQGDMTLRRLVADDISALHHMVAHLPAEVATFIVVPLASIALLVVLAGPAALWTLLPGVLAALYYLALAPHMGKRYGAQRMQIMGEMVSAVDDYARGIRVHRLYGSQTGALAAYHNAAEAFTRNMAAWVGRVATAAAVAIALLQAVATFAIAYTVAHQHDTTTLAAVLFFSLAIVTPALRLGHGLDYVATGRAAAARLAALLCEPTLPCGDVSSLRDMASNGSPVLEIRDAQLSLDGNRVLDGLSHRFASGRLTAITGASGTGKTSLLRVLAGLESLSGGAVYLAGVEMAQLHEQARHQTVLLVPQGGDVLQATVRENLALSAPDATDAQLVTALQQAQLRIDLDADAARLSGGEKQRIGLARAFLTTAPVVLLDEPTSALDNANAARLMDGLHTLAHTQGKTVVLVTHDPALAARADARLEWVREVSE
ncbi:ABC transporter [Ventosimonas gracilis]|uniref:ABC transporter n=1 Tax=Ventosimonas gracilis TaxID=1680762 RepID=A0A139SV40_9GAMM|nr:ABC transporter ATP-binding protein [Ventosimonas gracilis]KXU38476.1 ABC transporter [Ventosimonas gracilis]